MIDESVTLEDALKGGVIGKRFKDIEGRDYVVEDINFNSGDLSVIYHPNIKAILQLPQNLRNVLLETKREESPYSNHHEMDYRPNNLPDKRIDEINWACV